MRISVVSACLLIVLLMKPYFAKLSNITPFSNHERTLLLPLNETVDEIGPLISKELDCSLDNVYNIMGTFKPKQVQPVKGAFLALVRNESQLSQILSTMATINSKLEYPWIIIHESPISSDFKFAVQSFTKNKVNFGLSKQIYRHLPKNILENAMSYIKSKKVDYTALDTIMHMRQLYSGLFVNHTLLKDIDYIWRVRY